MAMKTASVVLIVLMASGCTPTATGVQARQEADKAAEKARIEEQQARESARKALDARLNELQHRIDALKQDTRPASKKARRDVDQEVARLRGEVADLRAKLATDEGRADAWKKMKQSTEDALQRIEQTLDQLGGKSK
jgi:chromosome segregation ATPase